MDNLSDWVKDETPNRDFWKPTKEGETLEGTVLEKKQGNFGLQITLKLADGSEVKTPSHKVLQNRLANKEVGQMLRIVYTGQLAPRVRGENPIQTYDVYTKAPQTQTVATGVVGGQI